MSYDITVYGDRALTRPELVDTVRAAAGLDSTDELGPGMQVVRGKRGAYCFTVDGPSSIEAEDLPDEVSAQVLGATVQYQVLVEGSAEVSIPHAIRFAKRLAANIHGAMLDEQTGEIWAASGNRKVARPARLDRIDIIDIDWYFTPSETDLAALYLSLARRHLPEALPRRFGSYEPLQHQLDAVGDAGFVHSANESRGSIYWKGTFPVLEGSLHARQYDGAPAELPRVSLSLERSAFDDPRWRRVLRAFFIEFAQSGKAYFAAAEVVRNLLWNGRSVSYSFDGTVEQTYSLVRYREGWMGLPPHPVWWSLFGAEYVPLISPHLPQAAVVEGGALFYAASDAPADRDELSRMLPTVGRLRRRRAPWLPSELLATALPPTPGRFPLPLAKAAVMPPEIAGRRW